MANATMTRLTTRDDPQNRKLMPRFVLKEMDCLYIEELRSSVNQLMVNLESLPVTKGQNESRYGLQKFRRYNNR